MDKAFNKLKSNMPDDLPPAYLKSIKEAFFCGALTSINLAVDDSHHNETHLSLLRLLDETMEARQNDQ